MARALQLILVAALALAGVAVPRPAAAQLDPTTNVGWCIVSPFAAGATSITVTPTGCGATLPSAAFNLSVCNATDSPADCRTAAAVKDPSYEVVRVTAGFGTDTLTITRAQEGTSDVNHNTGGKTYVVSTFTAKTITDINTALGATFLTTSTNSVLTNEAVLAGTANQVTVTGNTISLPTNQQLPTSAPTANGVYGLASSAASALSWNTSPNFKGPTPFVNALAAQFFVSNSTTTTDGTITSGTPTLTVASASTFAIGQGIYVIGAGSAGGVLETTISNIVSTTITLATNASTTVSSGTNNVGHSDTAGIQAALDFAVSANVGSAGVVRLPPGIYNVSGINIPHETWLICSGNRNTTLRSIPGATALGVVIINGTSKGSGLFDCAIDGNKGATPAPAGSGIYITSTLTAGLRDHRIENVSIDDAVLDGITITAPGPERVIYSTFRNVIAMSSGRHGFNLATEYVTDLMFFACYAGLSGSNGYNILGGTTQFVGTEADDSTADGYVFSGAGAIGNIVSGGRAANNLGHSFFFTGANATNTVDAFSYDPRADHVNIAGGTENYIRVTAVDPFGSANSDSMLDVTSGSGNVLNLTWPASAITTTALTGSALASQIITQNGSYYGAADVTFLDGADLILGTTTGSKIGTATSQKLGFFNATPIVQNTSTTDLRTGLVNLGLFASGGANPLNLNGGALTAAAGSFSGLLFVSQNAAAITPVGNPIELHAVDAAQATLGLYAYGSNTAITQIRHDGTAASRSAVAAASALGANNFGGWNGSAIVTNAARIRAFALETWSGSTNSTYFQFDTVSAATTGAGAARMLIDRKGVLLGAALVDRSTTNPSNSLTFVNGTAPAGTLTNAAQLYAASGELNVMDSAGNNLVLSPHDDVTGEWIFYGRNSVTGQVLRVDMEAMMKKLDALLGGGFVTEFQYDPASVMSLEGQGRLVPSFRFPWIPAIASVSPRH